MDDRGQREEFLHNLLGFHGIRAWAVTPAKSFTMGHDQPKNLKTDIKSMTINLPIMRASLIVQEI